MNTLNILIVEDKEKHIANAQKFADECGHNVTIAKTYEEAERYLYGDRDIFKEGQGKMKFDVVMTDLFLPASLTQIGNQNLRDQFEDTEQPYGFSIILLALMKGIPFIGLHSDGNHHDHPMIAALDPVDSRNLNRGKIQSVPLGNAKVLFTSGGPFSDGGKDWATLFTKLTEVNS